MPRKGPVTKRDVLPDPVYNSKLVTRLINRIMLDGKRGVAQSILYNSFNIIKERTGNDPMEVFEVFDGASEYDVFDTMEEAGMQRNGKTVLYDGRTGERFEREVKQSKSGYC